MKYLEGIYSQNDIAWFTPVELFKVMYYLSFGILYTHDLLNNKKNWRGFEVLEFK